MKSDNRNPDWDPDYTVARCENKLLRDTPSERIHGRKETQIKSEKDATQMFRGLAEMGCETECESKKKKKKEFSDWSQTQQLPPTDGHS